MFRALTCPSSGGKIVFTQHLVSSLSVNACTVHWSALNQCTVQAFTDSEDTRCCVNTIFPPEDGHVNARNMSRVIVLTNILLVNKENCALKLVDEIIFLRNNF